MGGKTDRRISIGQRISMGFREPTITEEVRQVIRDWKVGNIVFFSENVASLEQFSALCAELKDLIKAETGLPPLLMLDEEGGLASRLGGIFGDTPWPMAVGETDREENARSMGRVLGERLRMAGANMNLAPVLDCLAERESPVMACRPFSDDPKKVARLGRAWIEGAHEAGILTCGKHFPGHGRTRMDSHAALPVIDCSLEEMMETDLLPFREAIAAGTDALMSAHIVFPALEPEGLPATVSARILQGLVREKLGFDGLMLHASAVVVDGKAYLFTADSGTGKSTHTRLWLERFGSRAYILNDDKPALRLEEDGWYAYGTPWSGKNDISVDARVPVAGIAVIERAAENSIAPFGGVPAIREILKQVNRPRDTTCREKLLELMDLLITRVPVWKLRCNMDPEAAEVSFGAMSKEGK